MMIQIGKKPLALEFILDSVRNWDKRFLDKQFTFCHLHDEGLVLTDLPSYRKRDSQLDLSAINIKQIIFSKRFFKLELASRDQWSGVYPEFLVPFGPCPKKMIFRFAKQKESAELLRRFALEHQIEIKE